MLERQLADRRQAVAGLEQAARDQSSDLIDELPVDRMPGLRVQYEQGIPPMYLCVSVH
jgi:hypothetical protein